MKNDAQFQRLTNFVRKLKQNKIYHTLDSVRDDGIMVIVAVPGERWEVEFMEDGKVEIERFASDGTILDESEIEKLFERFSD